MLIKNSVLLIADKLGGIKIKIRLIAKHTTLLIVLIAINPLMLMVIRTENIAHMNAILKTGLPMSNEFKFYTSYILFLNIKEKDIITNKEFNEIVQTLIEKYNVSIMPFLLEII